MSEVVAVKIEQSLVDAGLVVLATELMPHPQNPRRGDMEKIAQSLAIFGQVRPVLVQKSSGYICAGNHTFRAATELLGWDRVARVVADFSDEDAKRYLVADNRLADLGTYDQQVMAPILEGLMLGGLLDGTGYTPDQVDDYLSEADALPETTPEDFKGDFAESAEDTAARYRPPTEVQPMRQFVFLFPQDQAAEVETNLKTLAKAWGVGATRDVVAEALRRAISAEMDKGSTG